MHPIRKIWRTFKGSDRRARSRYLETAEHPRLHIGASNRVLDGWLNTDLFPSTDVSHLDATERFPYNDRTFDYVYTEHMIEHIPYDAASAMLRECFRVLRPCGTIRIVTPNLDAILSLRAPQPEPLAQSYLDWMYRTFTPDAGEPPSTFVLNAMFRAWGHEFIHDEPSLANLLITAGFKDPTRCNIAESSHDLLQNLSNSTRYPEGLLEFESICIEAERPCDA